MSELRFHLDEDAEAHALIRALRDRGADVTTASEAGLSEVSDEEQLLWSSAYSASQASLLRISESALLSGERSGVKAESRMTRGFIRSRP